MMKLTRILAVVRCTQREPFFEGSLGSLFPISIPIPSLPLGYNESVFFPKDTP